jgi:HIV Tat-specific factor 1
VSTRELANIMNGNSGEDDDNDNDNKKGEIEATTRIFPSTVSSENDDANGEWKPIQDSHYLQLAIEALAEVTSMPTTWPTNNDEIIDSEQVATMTYDNIENEDSALEIDGLPLQNVHDDLEAFLSSTDHLARHASVTANGSEEEEEEEYNSDGGTKYIRDSRTGNWIHEALAPKREKKREMLTAAGSASATSPPMASSTGANTVNKKRKRNKAKFNAKNARNWIYVTGLPNDTNEEEVAAYFSKVGIIDLDPETQKPKIKLYRHKQEGESDDQSRTLKGDASICYARPESVELALQILDENLFRDGATLSVQRAKFEQHGTLGGDSKAGVGRRMISEAKRKVARLAALQAVGWDEGENGRIAGGLKGLRIVVLMNMFDPADFQKDTNDEKLKALEKEVRAECEEFGTVEKITLFSKHPAGVMIVKFTQPAASSEAVTKFNGKVWAGRKVEASYWDGVTDYTCHDAVSEEKEAEKRLDEFGDWLENQDLPDEFQLKVED